VGGAATLAQSLKAVRAAGSVVLVGHTPNDDSTPSLVPIIMREIRVQGVLVGPRTAFEALVSLLEKHELMPVVDRVFRMNEIVPALSHLASGRAFGKVCVRLA
jgi:D-arabinose 1-dehydrogenase-like Zn-dependent alcohol dehydrogenase